MSYVITNGNYFIMMTSTGGTAKTMHLDEAKKYIDINKAIERIKKCYGKCKGYYILDLDTMKKYTKKKRVIYPQHVRKKIYYDAMCRCSLCGRKILYNDMTLDHIVPLAMGGIDDISNLACACEPCNKFKGCILPDDFIDKIKTIFFYQIDKKYKKNIAWKITKCVLEKL